ncbi:MAG: preQ(1) synthase [Desulfurella sp.]|jgi:7-cyano-7-deazaguanine reductase|uniref:NADPH-dependent 7-cyano-7-deazaguanine reductase n=1 Tax=Desulfurella multipotens TaxID=79269 RepID=A0A1G6NY90_9BACT|nr:MULTISPECIES: preQ(1) synthase [Desulfurella]AHF96594.1 7-cyano-7-deazaguanine reductase [Desulfurella acetivorans A63]HEX13323.1 NADPH-dependent 7-cyano-7-deazaguanine reductase QueF [Desulfurella acetivorans]PMP69044.1 MAG: NADPH-dependent 7-cyano-7-deazaguanine reductase QueF [Desulfurella multipotens]PMP91686.1 MAG: NADPH-dependent 7-cyano-7-deazaguanine reductase QueF [Desulfurella sp.]SDC72197.1 7-cyano-7-deazaguanine reductase [Desulfurella multipotens]
MRYGEEAILNNKLEKWENKNEFKFEIHIEFGEFTCLCPRSGYPDFATIRIKYVPDKYVVELKSLKLFLNSFRNKYISHEDSINLIYSTLFNFLEPIYLEIIGDFNPRGNVKTIIKIDSNMQGEYFEKNNKR